MVGCVVKGVSDRVAEGQERRGFTTFIILWATQSLSVWGNSVRFFTITFWITGVLFAADGGRAAFALAAVSIAVALTAVVVAPLAGSWADRGDRRRLMLVCDLLSAVASLSLGALMYTQRLNLPALLAWVVGFSALRSVHRAAFGASYAMLLSPKQLPRGNAMMQTSTSLAGVVAPGIAAVLISLPAARLLPRFDHLAVTGAPFALAADALTFLVAGISLAFLAIPSPTRGGGRSPGLRAHFAEGLAFLRRQPGLLWLLAVFAVSNLLLPGAFVLQPVIVRFQLARSWTALGLSYAGALAVVTSALSAGAVAGGALVSVTGGLKSGRMLAIVVGLLVQGVALAAFGAATNIYVAAGLMLLLGALAPGVNAHSQAVWQTLTPKALQGRVFAVRRVAASGLSPVGIALGGALSAMLAAGPVVVGMGVVLAVFAAAQLLNPALLRADAAVAGEGSGPDTAAGAALPATTCATTGGGYGIRTSTPAASRSCCDPGGSPFRR